MVSIYKWLQKREAFRAPAHECQNRATDDACVSVVGQLVHATLKHTCRFDCSIQPLVFLSVVYMRMMHAYRDHRSRYPRHLFGDLRCSEKGHRYPVHTHQCKKRSRLSGPEPSPATHQPQPTDSRLGVRPHISRCTPLER